MLLNAFSLLFLLAILFFSFRYFLWPRFINYIFWYKSPGSQCPRGIFQKLLTRNDRVYTICGKICDTAAEKGFKFNYPWIAVTKPWVRPTFFWGIAYYSANAIIINHDALKLSNNSDISALIAHELGHLIDYQTKRKGHSFFTKAIVALEKEDFAWAFAAYITSLEAVKNYFESRS